MNDNQGHSRRTVVSKATNQRRPAFWRLETIRQKLLFGFLVTLVFVVFEGAAVLWGLNRIEQEVDHTLGDTDVALLALDLRRQGESFLEPARHYMLTGDAGDPARFETSANAMHDAMHELSGMLGGASGIHVHETEGDLLHEAEESWYAMNAGAREILAVPDPVGNEETTAQLQALEPEVEQLLVRLDGIYQGRLQDAARTRAIAESAIGRMMIFAVVGTLFAASSGMIAAQVISRRITRPVAAMTLTATDISKGDLDTSLEVDSGGEIGELAEAIERMRISLKLMFARLNREQHVTQDTPVDELISDS